MGQESEKPSDYPEAKVEEPRASEVRAVDAARVDEAESSRDKMRRMRRKAVDEGEMSLLQMEEHRANAEKKAS